MTDPFAFPLMTAGFSRRPCWAIGKDEALAEIERELAERRAVYPGLVRRGSLSAADADRQIATLAAAGRAIGGTPDASGPAWRDMVAELRREIALRRRLYPRWLAEKRIAEPAARKQIEGIEAAHWRLWIAGDGFGTGSNADPATIAADWRAHAIAIALWERAALAAGDPAARSAEAYWWPPRWTDDQRARWLASGNPDGEERAAA